MLEQESSSRSLVSEPIHRALDFLRATQSSEGSWKGDYGGPLFLLPMFVGSAHILGLELSGSTRTEMIKYLRNHQNVDGGWGLHIESESYVFTSVLSYVALRLLGVSADDERLAQARQWFLPRGGALQAAPWGKFMLAVLELYDYEGVFPVPPEVWLLPESLAIHPSRMWCHCRMVYLPMAYLYGRRFSHPANALIREIRTEIYAERYETIDWPKFRYCVADTDRYVPKSPLLRAAEKALSGWERTHVKALRDKALTRVLDHIRQEDVNSNYLCLGPINKLYNTLSWHFTNPGGPEVEAHKEKLGEYLWQADDGLKMNGYTSSELWDTAFAVQAIKATRKMDEYLDVLSHAHRFIRDNQILQDTAFQERYYRHSSKGSWPFSTAPSSWPTADCTAEGLKASLILRSYVHDPLSTERLNDAVDYLLSMQNEDGGWATYERVRGPKWLELLNPSACFADIMIEYSYVECTSACIQAFKAFQEEDSRWRSREIIEAIRRGRDYILRTQRADGSWEGSWGICFTYGTWFGIEGLLAAGLGTAHPAIVRACSFLLSKQLPDGGWGETPESCTKRDYVHAECGQAVMTSWVILALIHAGHRDSEAVRRGIQFLKDRQRPDGSWPPEHIAGVFNKTCAIHYDNYLKIFPLWALALAETTELS